MIGLSGQITTEALMILNYFKQNRKELNEKKIRLIIIVNSKEKLETMSKLHCEKENLKVLKVNDYHFDQLEEFVVKERFDIQLD